MNRKNLTYEGMSARRRQALLNNIENINLDLRYERLRVVLEPTESVLNLRWTIQDGRRYKRSPKGVDLSPHGVETARRLAIKIGHAIRDDVYTEEWYKQEIAGVKVQPDFDIPLLWGEVQMGFPELWLKYRSGDSTATDRQKASSLKHYTVQLRLADARGIISQDTEFNKSAIDQLLSLEPEGSDKKFRLRETLSIVCTLYNVSYNFKGIGKRPKSKKRDVPSDEMIIDCWKYFDNILLHPNSVAETVQGYRWLYSVLATYGLRPQELFAINLEKSFKPEHDYWLYLDESATDGLKTGNRLVAPLHPSWVEMFNICEIRYPPLMSTRLVGKVAAVANYFRHHKIGFPPYSLRHAYAIRCRLLGINLIDAADLLGHDVATHTKIYQRWIGDNERIESVRKALSRKSRDLVDQFPIRTTDQLI